MPRLADLLQQPQWIKTLEELDESILYRGRQDWRSRNQIDLRAEIAA